MVDDTNKFGDSNDYVFTFVNQPKNITMCFGESSIIISKEKITYIGFKNADEATIAFLNKLVEVYPNWKENLK